MIDGNDATGVTARSNDTLSFSFPTTSNGIHNVSISGLESLQGVRWRPTTSASRPTTSPRSCLELDRRRGGPLAGSADRGHHV